MSIRPRRSLLNPELRRPSALNSIPRAADRLWLDKNENLDPWLMALSHEVMLDIPPTALATYPEAGETYRKLARWIGVTPESLLLTPGSDGAIRLTFEAFVEHGEPVVHTFPTFAMYPVYSQMFGADAHRIEYSRSDEGPSLDVAALLGSLRAHRPKLFCLPNPDSPTGTTVPPDVLREILSECESVGAVLLLDEAYHPFYPWSAASWTETSQNLIVARTFAKAWGAAGLRIGYAVAHPDTIGLLHKLRPMYEVSTIAVEFMSRMLDHQSDMEQAVARINDGKSLFVDEMTALGFKVLPTAGNFLHVAFGARGPGIHKALSGKVLYRADFDHPCLAGYSRFTVAPRETMARVVELIKEAVS
jgi:Histidinol-phosphate/aromatic aminotransferase and cobyric acid decarboxylase